MITRPMLLSLALIACAPEAPDAPAGVGKKDPARQDATMGDLWALEDRIEALEAANASQAATIGAQAAAIAALQASVARTDVEVPNLVMTLAESHGRLAALEDATNSLANDVIRAQLTADEASALAHDNAIHVANQGALNNQIYGRLAAVEGGIGALTASDALLAERLGKVEGAFTALDASLAELHRDVKAKLTIEVAATAKRVDAAEGAISALQQHDVEVDAAVDNLGNGVREVKELADILKNEYGIRLAAAESGVQSLVRDVKELADILKNEYGIEPRLAAAESSLQSLVRDVKELADILKSDYGIEPRLAAVEGTLAAQAGWWETVSAGVGGVWTTLGGAPPVGGNPGERLVGAALALANAIAPTPVPVKITSAKVSLDVGCGLGVSAPASDRCVARRGAAFRVVLGLNTTKEDPNVPLAAVLEDAAGAFGAQVWFDSSNQDGSQNWSVVLPDDAPIGTYTLSVSGPANEVTLTTPVTVLFNPYLATTPEYFPAKAAIVDQWLTPSTASLYLPDGRRRDFAAELHVVTQKDGRQTINDFSRLDDYFDAVAALDLDGRRDPAAVVDAIVHHTGANVLHGRWDGDYRDGREPWSWTGSAEILANYRKGGQVKYGQCWVFSAMTQTMARTFGIPTRAVTNLQSAHERAGYDSAFIAGETNAVLFAPYSGLNGCVEPGSDGSVWNFHVWNEAWVSAKDASGWQAYDATPQE